MKARKRNFKQSSETFNFWPSFADVMSTIVLIFFLLMLLVLIINIMIGDQLKETKASLEAESAQLLLTMEKLYSTKDELDAKLLEIDDREEELIVLISDIDEQTLLLKLADQKLKNQEKIIANSNKKLGDLQSQLATIAVLKTDILTRVKEAIEVEVGAINDNGNAMVYIGDNANIIIGASVVFDYNSAILKPAGKDLLDKFATAFENVLKNPDIRQNIDAINIEGHTDGDGSGVYNMILASQRATNVVNYLFESNITLEELYGKYFSSNAMSKFRPIAENDTDAGKQQNRRIEISVRIKDPDIPKIIQDYLDDSKDDLVVPDN